ncbi:mechanosensitive channel MscK [Halopseudomonas yangmingensis]|uniref:Potassium efflux system protein n=1 Tax=Halopseudomonas yangmingensis TaxID=1720063 RepID=A0A1I4PST2_9GAMM|nr:mechanosensitive channel MscK [Halopseudomonas yangmingensis]SFM30838.1 potassium efflux system protein [Halopseudomonas yangmingensis]
MRLTASLQLLLLALCLLCTPARAQQADLNEALQSVRASLEALPDSGASEAERRELQEIFQQTIGFLQRSQSLQGEQVALREQIDRAPQSSRDVRLQLERLKTVDGETLRRNAGRQDLVSLEQALELRVTQMFNWQNELTAVNSELIAAQTRPERTQNSVTANQNRELAINEQLRNLQRQPSSNINQARIGLLRSELQSLQISTELLQQRLNNNAVLQDLANRRRDLLTRQIADIEQEIQIFQELINNKRLADSEQTLSEVSAGLDADNHQLLRQQASINRQLSEELLRATTEVGELTRKNLQTRQQIDSLTQIDRALEQQIDVLKGSLLLSRILHQQKKALPQLRVDGSLANRIADLRLRQFELNQIREELANPAEYVERQLASLPEQQREGLVSDLQQLANHRLQLSEQLSSNIDSQLSLAVSLQINQRQLQQLSSDLQRTIDDQLFWVASNRPIDRHWLHALPTQLVDELQKLHLHRLAVELLHLLLGEWPWFLLLALLMGVYAWRRPLLRQQLHRLHQDVGHFREDSGWHTPKALLLTTLLVLPLPLLMLTCSWLLWRGAQPAMPLMSAVLLQMALAWLVIHLMYRVLDPQGIAGRHFRWDNALVQRLHRLTGRGSWVLLPLVIVTTLGMQQPDQLSSSVLNRMVMIGGLIGYAWLLGRLLWRSQPLYSSRLVHLSITLILTAVPLILAGMTWLGYQYAAVKLAARFIDSLYLIVLWMLLDGTLVRNLNVAGRRLAWQRAMSKRATTTREGIEGEVQVEVPELDIRQVNQQSLRLSRLLLTLGFGVALYFTWSDLISATSYLQSVTLWEYNSGTADNPLLVPMSAADVLGALVIVLLTVTLARNLPGLLEILLLSRLNLAQGSGYAITTLLSYAIVSIGVITTLSALGVSWNKLQWLVAALSVGLGFGLQEIFANFVSGLIILFERPVRIGDVVTIGNLSGTVNRIRIRATTITDFDRKEIIVPNKTFVTSQLINWSLSDTVTRVTIRIGVAYGSDLQKVRELLYRIANGNSRVLRDPEPMVLFLNFGDSTLDHELRIHVRELRDRNPAIDEINREIDRLFREHGIEIAFRQMDINLRNSEGLERLVLSSKPQAAS